jgi:hypothetical protein
MLNVVCAPYYNTYINTLSSQNVLDMLEETYVSDFASWHKIPAEKWDYAYADNKWTIKEVLQHVIDTERIMAYRALAFARGESSALPGFDQDVYVTKGNAKTLTSEKLMDDFRNARKSSISFFSTLTKTELALEGVASNNKINVLALGLIIAGHGKYHVGKVQELYL